MNETLPIAVQYLDGNGKPLSGGKVFFCQAGSFTVPKAAFTVGDVPAANPTILDSSGNCPQILGPAGDSYNVLVTTSGGTSVLTYEDLLVPSP
jgi:hypothetical protein